MCGRCSKECALQSEGLVCALCRQWIHIKCMENATPEHVEMGDMINHLFGTGRFLCNTCVKVAPRLNGDLLTIRAKVESMEQKAAIADAERAAMKAMIEALQAQLALLQTNNNQVKEKVVEMEKEIETGMEQAKKEWSVIFFA